MCVKWSEIITIEKKLNETRKENAIFFVMQKEIDCEIKCNVKLHVFFYLYLKLFYFYHVLTQCATT